LHKCRKIDGGSVQTVRGRLLLLILVIHPTTFKRRLREGEREGLLYLPPKPPAPAAGRVERERERERGLV
jgi:hypothetical protein